MKKILLALALGPGLLAVPAVGRAARVEADPNKEYVLSPEAGPYAILVKAYMGDEAHQLADQLALHLRQNGWPAYVFDYTPEEERKAKEWLDLRYANAPPEVQRSKRIRVQQQWGVFVGGYRDFDGASRDIARLRKTPEPHRDPGDIDLINPQTGQLFQLHTYAQCIATRNPTVPRPQQDANAPDPAWKDLNDGRPYNLLKVRKPWTLAVKQFQGTGAIQPRSASSEFLNMIGLGNKSGEMLEASARQAEEVARVLCELKFDAYVLHTRTGSIVTVGTYDRQDDPALLRAAERLRGGRIGNEIRLFDQPLPMPVPRL
jgi:hypothetical protein